MIDSDRRRRSESISRILTLHVVARLDDLARVLDVVLGELGDVHEALDAVEDLDERAERDDLGDRALELVADVVGVDDALPRVLLGLLEAQGDALAVAVDVEHLDLRRCRRSTRISLGWLTCDHESSEMWIRPSMPSRSTNAPKSTMFEIWPSMTRPGCRRSRIAWRCSLRSSSSTARRESTTLLRERLSSMTLRLDLLAQVLVEVRHAADVDQRGGQEAAHPEVDDQAALDDLDDRAVDGLAGLGGGLDAAPGALEAGALLGQDQAAVLVLLGEDERVDLLAELDLLVRVDRLADRELVGGDDPLALVADVDEDLVLVDPHDLAGDDVALLEGDDRGVVVGDDLAVDLEQQPVGALDDLGVRWRSGWWSWHPCSGAG